MSRGSVISKIFAIAAFVTAALAFSLGQVTFTATAYNSGDSDTSSIVTGDFDNDGTLDLVTVNYNSISFYKGLGGGKYAPARNQVFGLFYRLQAVAADFNRDGRLDLAISCSDCSFGTPITVLLGNGNGTFNLGTGVPESDAAYFIATADFNGDHLPDLAVSACDSSNQCFVQIYLGKGDGTFTQQSATLNYGGKLVVAGDFNADGHQDVAVLTASFISDANIQLALFLGNGNGTFQSAIVANQPYGESLAVGDFYNNRIQSLAVLSYSATVNNFYVNSARYSNGALQLTTPQLISTPGSFFHIAAGDLNGDFLDDVVVTGGGLVNTRTPAPVVSYMLGKGNGTFNSAVSVAGYAEDETFPFVRDLNLDGRHDIGAAWDYSYENSGGGAYVLLNNNATPGCTPPAPNALNVHICAPTSGQTVAATFTFKAAGNAYNGIAKRMELWIDGKKIGQNLEDQLKITTTLAAGKHTASFVVVDSFDNHISQSVSFTTN
jgi:hypothetical protein